jgi:hypothetical protein
MRNDAEQTGTRLSGCTRPLVTNMQFDSRPIVIHAHGGHQHKPQWQSIRDRFFASQVCSVGELNRLTILTCNNGHPGMGLLEKSLDHWGVTYQIAGRGIKSWTNSIHKPSSLSEAMRTIETEYTLYADSRDSIVVDDPNLAVERFESQFNCNLLFGADRLNWPPLKEFKQFEDSVAPPRAKDFRYLNGGMWIGRTVFCRQFFHQATKTEPLEESPESEQGILKQLFQRYHPQVSLDYECAIFQNIGFVFAPILLVQ